MSIIPREWVVQVTDTKHLKFFCKTGAFSQLMTRCSRYFQAQLADALWQASAKF